MIYKVLHLISLLVLFGCSTEKPSTFFLSDQRTTVQLFQFDDNQLVYTVSRNNQIVIDTSTLGIVVGNKTLGINAEIHPLEKRKVSLEYSLAGAKSKATYDGELFPFEIEEKDGFSWQLEFQLSDEGVAYRYIIPNVENQKVQGELSSFKFPPRTKVWYFERNNDWKLKSHAGEWVSADISQMPSVSKMGPVQGLTLTCELPNGSYVLLAEAALYNYSGMRLEAIGDNTFKANFTEGEKGFEVNGDIMSPWRCILLAHDLNDLVNNTMVASLNPAPDEQLFANQSWIKPGKSVWHWWTGKFATYEDELKMIDDAVSLGMDYSMVDEGWELWNNKWETTKQLCEYGKNKGIGIFLWKRSKEINFPENDYAVMASFLDSVKQAGAAGVKVDFMNGQTKSLIDFDEAVLRLTAERQLMVNFHGCQQSSGEYRTYPNEVTREGIRGIEVNGMKEGMLSASHNTALPFTRFVTGHADYTPLGFTSPGETTWAHQLATLICFYSPFQCIAEGTDFLLKEPLMQPALEFIKNTPPIWDETIVLPKSEIGQMAIMARRKGKDWFLGILGSGPQKQLQINCDFLGKGNYQTLLFVDDTSVERHNIAGLHPRNYFEEYHTVIPFKAMEMETDVNTQLRLKIAEHGGAAVWFKSVPPINN